MSLLNPTDRRILSVLQTHGRATLSDIAEVVNLSTSQVQRRIKHLEHTGVITGYLARVAGVKAGYQVGAFVEVTLKEQDTASAQAFHDAVQRMTRVLECHRVSGDADYLLRVVAKDLQDYSKLAQESIKAIPQVDRLRSLIIFESPKDTTVIPL